MKAPDSAAKVVRKSVVMSQQTSFGVALVVLVVLVGLTSAACSRTPPEPAPASTTNALPEKVGPRGASNTETTASASGRAGARCVTPMSSTAPLPPPASASASACPPDPEGIPKATIAEVLFPETTGTPRVEVELAITEHAIERGLMYRRTMADDHGMLFRLQDRREHTFWMHNTCISLDMLFIDDDGTVVGIVEGATPLTDTTRSVGCPSRYVLEVNAGWSRRHGVRAGQKIAIPSSAR